MPATTAVTVFGMDVRAELRLPLLERARAAPTGRPLEIRLDGAESARADRLAGGAQRDWVAGAAQLSWPPHAREICTRRHADGSAYLRIQAHPRAGYLIWGERRGTFLLSRDGQSLLCVPHTRGAQQWERFLVGQVLPFAALVAGLEIFHASAVVLDGRALAFVGPSGAGKTSLALELCRRGARFLADDVLALQARAQRLLAHAGTPAAGVNHREAERLREAGQPLPDERLGVDAREQLIPVEGACGPAPLGGLFLLDRCAQGSGEPRFTPAADGRMLLGCTFNFVLDTPRRMRGLLNACALAARGQVERIAITPATDAGALAAAVLARVETPS